MILKAEGGKRALKPSCKTVRFVASFSTLWLAAGRGNWMKAWSTDSPFFPLFSMLQTGSQRFLFALPPFHAAVGYNQTGNTWEPETVACYFGGLNTSCVHSCCPVTQLTYLSIRETVCEVPLGRGTCPISQHSTMLNTVKYVAQGHRDRYRPKNILGSFQRAIEMTRNPLHGCAVVKINHWISPLVNKELKFSSIRGLLHTPNNFC